MSNLSEEEKEAIEYIKDSFKATVIHKQNFEIVLNLINRLQSKLINISEVCIDESKMHISSEDAIERIRNYL